MWSSRGAGAGVQEQGFDDSRIDPVDSRTGEVLGTEETSTVEVQEPEDKGSHHVEELVSIKPISIG